MLNISLKNEDLAAVRAKQKIHISVVLAIDEVKKILFYTYSTHQLMLALLYGCGLRMSELLRLRIKGIDFSLDNVYIFDGKSQRDRIMPLPQKIKEDLRKL